MQAQLDVIDKEYDDDPSSLACGRNCVGTLSCVWLLACGW